MECCFSDWAPVSGGFAGIQVGAFAFVIYVNNLDVDFGGIPISLDVW